MAGRDTAFDMQIKLLMIGDSGNCCIYIFYGTNGFIWIIFLSLGVGKTCLVLRYANDSVSPTFITTIGIDFKIKNIQLDGKRIKLQVCRKCNCLFYKSVENWSFFQLKIRWYSRFGILLDKKDSEQLLLPTSVVLREFSLCTT